MWLRKRTWDATAGVLIVVGVIAPILSIAVYVQAFGARPQGDTADWALFGDYFTGVVGPILSATTVVAIALNLALQRKELRASRREVSRTQRQVREQMAEARRLAFDTTFYNMTAVFADVSRRMKPSERVAEISNMYLSQGHYLGRPRPSIANAYLEEHRHYQAMLGPYFRLLYQVVTAVDRARDLTDERKRGYVAFVRAQLSDDELRLMLANVECHPEGREGLRPLVLKYDLLKHARALDKPTFFDDLRKTTDLVPPIVEDLSVERGETSP